MKNKDKGLKIKEPVTIRERVLTGGKKSLYLDIYVKGSRKTESLGVFIYPGTDPATKRMNADSRKTAEQVKADRILALRQCGMERYDVVKKLAISLYDWMDEYSTENVNVSASTMRGRRHTRDRVKHYLDAIARPNMKLVDVDKHFCRGFLAYLKTAKNLRTTLKQRTISVGNAAHIQTIFTGALNKAVREQLIERNPMLMLDSNEKFQPEESKREFLTIEELRRAIDAPAKQEEVKRAFMFSAMTGLRLSDIKALTGKSILDNGDGTGKYVQVRMQKTQKWINVPLSKEAMRWLNVKDDPNEPIFKLFDPVNIEKHLGIWMENAGIEKHITFHSARHTFATTLITKGADIYTVSKLLGHSKIMTTEIYAKLIDQRRVEAVSKLDDLFT